MDKELMAGAKIENGILEISMLQQSQSLIPNKRKWKAKKKDCQKTLIMTNDNKALHNNLIYCEMMRN